VATLPLPTTPHGHQFHAKGLEFARKTVAKYPELLRELEHAADLWRRNGLGDDAQFCQADALALSLSQLPVAARWVEFKRLAPGFGAGGAMAGKHFKLSWGAEAQYLRDYFRQADANWAAYDRDALRLMVLMDRDSKEMELELLDQLVPWF